MHQQLYAEARAVLCALGFLTTLPLPNTTGRLAYQDGDFQRASAYYPLVGYLLGGLLWLAGWLLEWLTLPPLLNGVLLLGLWLVLTGLLHFDGAVDSADALLVAKSPVERLQILKDVQVGAFGLAVGVWILLLYAALLSSALPLYAPLLAVVLSRALVALPMYCYPAARAKGLGQQSRPSWWRLLLAMLWLLPLFWLPNLLLALALALSGVIALAAWAARRLGGGLTGDVYGLLIVLAELLALLAQISR